MLGLEVSEFTWKTQGPDEKGKLVGGSRSRDHLRGVLEVSISVEIQSQEFRIRMTRMRSKTSRSGSHMDVNGMGLARAPCGFLYCHLACVFTLQAHQFKVQERRLTVTN